MAFKSEVLIYINIVSISSSIKVDVADTSKLGTNLKFIQHSSILLPKVNYGNLFRYVDTLNAPQIDQY